MFRTAEQFLQLPEVRGRWPGSCFGCSAGHPHGLRLRFRHTETGVVSLCTVPEEFCSFAGMVHGGIITTLLDEAAAWALMARHGRLGVTRELTSRFLKPVPTGTALQVEARIVAFEPPAATVETSIYDAAGVVLAEGASSWAFPRLERIAALVGIAEEALQCFLDDCQHPGR